MQAMSSSAPRRISLALVLALTACEDDELQCDAAPEADGTATFEGKPHTFDDAYATIYMAGPHGDPCVKRVSVTASGETGSLRVSLSRPQGGGPLAVSGIGFGGPYSAEDYGLWPEDLAKFNASFEIDERSDSCAQASLTFAGSNGRMYLEASEDFGPYSLKDVQLAVSGTMAIEWSDGACE